MNIAMEQTEEYVNGQLKNKYGDAFIRGNNGNPSNLHHNSPDLVCFAIFIAFNFSCGDAVLYISTSKRSIAEGG